MSLKRARRDRRARFVFTFVLVEHWATIMIDAARSAGRSLGRRPFLAAIALATMLLLLAVVLERKIHARVRTADPVVQATSRPGADGHSTPDSKPADRPALAYLPRRQLDTGGFASIVGRLKRWSANPTLEEIAASWRGEPARNLKRIDRDLADPAKTDIEKLQLHLERATFLNFTGDPRASYDSLVRTRAWLETTDRPAEIGLYSLIFFQGVSALRRGETDNCVMCRGESSCILPISPAAVHTQPDGVATGDRAFHRVSRPSFPTISQSNGCLTWPT